MLSLVRRDYLIIQIVLVEHSHTHITWWNVFFLTEESSVLEYFYSAELNDRPLEDVVTRRNFKKLHATIIHFNLLCLMHSLHSRPISMELSPPVSPLLLMPDPAWPPGRLELGGIIPQCQHHTVTQLVMALRPDHHCGRKSGKKMNNHN